MNILGWILDATPWWVWGGAGLFVLVATYQVWLPLWRLLPSPIKTTLIVIATGGLAFLAGRNRGSAGALDRAKEQEQARADDIRENGARARARAERSAGDGGLLDDGWRRKD